MLAILVVNVSADTARINGVGPWAAQCLPTMFNIPNLYQIRFRRADDSFHDGWQYDEGIILYMRTTN